MMGEQEEEGGSLAFGNSHDHTEAASLKSYFQKSIDSV